MKKVGEILKAEREKKGLSLHEIGMSLKINAKILKAIEDGSNENLPAKTFLRGFIRSYAQYLKLDPDEILRLFQEENGEVSPTSVPGSQTSAAARPAIERLQNKTNKGEDPGLETLGSTNKWVTVVGAVILLILIGSVIKVMNKYQKETEVPSAEEVAHLEPVTTPTAEDSSTTTTLPDDSTTTTLTDGAVTTLLTSTTLATTTSSLTVTSTTTTLASTTTTTRPTTTTTVATTTTTVRPTTTSTTRPTTTTTLATTTTRPPTTTTAVTTTTLAAATGKPVEAILEATSPVSIRYRFAGAQWKTVELSAGQIHTFKSPGLIEFEISDGGAVNAIVNGVVKGTLGKSGSPAVFTAK